MPEAIHGLPAVSQSSDDASVRLLITGAAGFVGHHLVCAALLRYPKVEVIAADLRPANVVSSGVRCHRLRQVQLDVRNAAECASLVEAMRPTHVIHAAAVTSGQDSDLVAVNLHGTMNLVNAVVEAIEPVNRFLFLSSSAVYGAPHDAGPCDENHPLDLTGIYARTKHDAETYLDRHAGQVSMVSARLGPCYGPYEVAGPFRSSISLVGQLLRALYSDDILRVGGEDYLRDWTYLDDIASAVLALTFAPDLGHRIYNVSAGIPISAREMIRCFQDRGLRVEWRGGMQPTVMLRATDGRKPLVIDRLIADTRFLPHADWRQSIASLIDRFPKASATH